MSDSLYSEIILRILNIIDDFERFAAAEKVEFSITSERLVRILNEVSKVRSLPKQIVVYNGPEFTSKTFLRWLSKKKSIFILLHRVSQPKMPFIESFNGKMRNECLNGNWFKDIEKTKRLIEEWRFFYNSERPHSSLGGLTPEEYLRRSA
nr:integrase core domain-containing protein [Leptospira interrogans]